MSAQVPSLQFEEAGSALTAQDSEFGIYFGVRVYLGLGIWDLEFGA